MEQQLNFNDNLYDILREAQIGIGRDNCVRVGKLTPELTVAYDKIRGKFKEATAREARLVDALEQEVYRLNNHDTHLDIGGMAEDVAVPCPVCQACDRIWAIIHPEDINPNGDAKSLDDQIASGTKSWDGVDTDKFTDEMRGR